MGSVKSDNDRLYSSQFLSNLPSTQIHQPSLPSLSILNSLTGQRVTVNSYKFNSLDSLKEYISSSFNIPANLLFILTPFGIKLKFSMILHDQINEIYVFDRNCFNLSDSNRLGLIERLRHNDPFTFSKPLESPLLTYEGFKKDNLRGSINALKRNSGWAAALLSDLKQSEGLNLKETEDDSIEVILRSLNVLIQYLGLSTQSLRKNLEGSVDYLRNLKKHSLISSWEEHYRTLKNVSFNLEKVKLNLGNSISKVELSKISKEALLKFSEVDQLLESLNYRVKNEIGNGKQKLEKECDRLRERYHGESNELLSTDDLANSQVSKLQSLVKEITEDVNDLPLPDSGNVEQVETCYKRHLEVLIPEIIDISNEMYNNQVNLYKNRMMLQQTILDSVFLDVARIQINLINTQKLITNELHPMLTALQSTEARLSVVVDLPFIFGILIISKYKNYRWYQNFRKVCFKTNEIFEMLQFLEVNSRIKWVNKLLGTGSSSGDMNSRNGLLNHYRDYLGTLKQKDFVDDHMAVLQLLFESKQNNKIIVDTSATKSLNNKTFTKFIDTLNNNHINDGNDDSNVWADIQVTNYKDVENYIEKLREVFPQSAVPDRLEKYVSDCGFRTDATYNVDDLNFMKFYKKFLKNYEMNGFVLEFGDDLKAKSRSPALSENEEAIIKGYESRVKKLENLLHQQQFLQFNQQFQPSGVARNLNPLNNGTLNDGANSIVAERNRQPITLPHNRKFSSGSTISDGNENDNHKIEVDRLTEENKDLKKQIEELNRKLVEKDDSAENEKLSSELQETRSELKAANAKVEELNKAFEDVKQKLTAEILQWQQNYNDVNSMKNDLIDNMSSLRRDHEEESSFYLKKIDGLNSKLEELQIAREEYLCSNSKLSEVIHDKNQVIESLSSIVDSMYSKLKELSQKLFIDISESCVILESIGLLLVEDNGEKKIVRVKGLKKNKSLKQEISSDVIAQVEKNLYWTDLSIENETTSVKDMVRESSSLEDSEIIDESSISELDIHSKALIHKFNNENFEKNYQIFLKSFETSDQLLISSITKRFKDVENLARKFQKDLTSQKIEIDSLSSLVNSKISIRNFELNDLVLFLPTIEEFNKGASTIKQWAAFNLGAPHYFLRNNSDKGDQNDYIDLSNRDWLVARILKIEEFEITDENYMDEKMNPFKLSIGVSWFFVDAKEDVLER